LQSKSLSQRKHRLGAFVQKIVKRKKKKKIRVGELDVGL
jgi:hypothetical protein